MLYAGNNSKAYSPYLVKALPFLLKRDSSSLWPWIYGLQCFTSSSGWLFTCVLLFSPALEPGEVASPNRSCLEDGWGCIPRLAHTQWPSSTLKSLALGTCVGCAVSSLSFFLSTSTLSFFAKYRLRLLSNKLRSCRSLADIDLCRRSAGRTYSHVALETNKGESKASVIFHTILPTYHCVHTHVLQ